MISTYGLTHIALAVRNVQRASRFYQQVFGAIEVYRSAGFVQLQTPGTHDVIVLEQSDAANIGQSAGIAHFGFRLQHPADIDAAAAAVKRAGGRVTEQGEFCPGEPYVFATDVDGYSLEIWFELPTRVDRPMISATARSRRNSSGRARRVRR